MSRITGSEVRSMIEAYNAVYVHPEVEEEQLDEAQSASAAGGGQAAINQLVKQGVSPIEAKVRVSRAGQGELNRQSSARTSNQSLQSGKAVNVNTSAGSGLLGRLELQNQKAKLNSKGELEVSGTNRNFAQDKSITFGGKGYNRLTAADGSVKYVPGKGSAPLKPDPTSPGATKPAPTSPGATKPAPTSPVATKPAPTSPTATKPAPTTTPTTAGKSGMDIWKAKYANTLAKNVNPDGTQKGTGQSTMAKQAAELRSMQASSRERQGSGAVANAIRTSGTSASSTPISSQTPSRAFAKTTPSLGSSSSSIQSAGSSAGAALKPVTSTQATAAAPSTSPAASGSVAPITKTIASAPTTPPVAPKVPPVKKGPANRDEPLWEGVDAYDLVLEYLLNNGHVDTVDEALYVMMEMDVETIGTIVEGGFNSSGRYDVGGGRTVGPVAGAIRSLVTGNLPKQKTYIPPSPRQGTNTSPAVPPSKDDSGKSTDFGAGGGKAKMKTGMTVGQVERQGRMNKGDYSG